MKVLIVKTSSMGDVLHTLPAVTDAGKNIPNIQFDWVVEESLAEIPAWHPLVNRVIPVAIRRWRKNIFSAQHFAEIKQFWRQLRSEHYDYVIDAQGLLKSVLLTKAARGVSCGFDAPSARETSASYFYQHKFTASWQEHAVQRLRRLFAGALNYSMPMDAVNYGVDRSRLSLAAKPEKPFVIFLHGTTWETKHWPEQYWCQLAKLITQAGFAIKIPWGNSEEQARALRIANQYSDIEVLPKLNLAQIAGVLARASAAVAVDTGLGHLAAALSVPTIALYGPTDAKLTGTVGANQIHLQAQFGCSPCFKKICDYQGNCSVEPACFGMLPPAMVWRELSANIKQCSTALVE